MPSLKEVRTRISSVQSTQQITKAMKMVAAAKLRRAQNAVEQMRPYAQKLESVIQNVSAAIDDPNLSNAYADEREANKVLLVLVTSDKGLCGAFNANIFKAALAKIQGVYASQYAAGNVKLLCIGKKGMEYFQRRGYDVVSDFSDVQAGKSIDFQDVRPAAEYAMQGFENGDFDRVEIIYNEFKNVATQIVRDQVFLPIAPPSEEESKVDAKTPAVVQNYIFEPSQAEILTELVPKSLKIRFFSAVLDSNASEHGARMTAMDKATENAGELLKELKLTYNQTRQAYITNEILEIVGGAEALAQS